MSIKLNCGLPTQPQVLHHMPCAIDGNDEANVSTYFQPQSKQDGLKTKFSAVFRGRPLEGKTIVVPNGYMGMVLTEKRKPFSEDEDRAFDLTGTFDSFQQWYLDSQYLSKNTVETACLSWAKDIAAAIHDPVAIE